MAVMISPESSPWRRPKPIAETCARQQNENDQDTKQSRVSSTHPTPFGNTVGHRIRYYQPESSLPDMSNGPDKKRKCQSLEDLFKLCSQVFHPGLKGGLLLKDMDANPTDSRIWKLIKAFKSSSRRSLRYYGTWPKT
eukprot:COSAG05_NODE_4863_length_1343_cov_1.930868_1_plen_137_part_00